MSGEHPPTTTLPGQHLEYTQAWGMASGAVNYVYRPATLESLRQVFAVARQTGASVGMRGAGRSYGDAALNGENILLDLSRMSRILDWDAENGIITVEPGVTIEKLWRYVLADGWWPAVVPGTMFPTLGGCLGMNIHGKNNWKAGTIGDHVLEFEALLPTGELVQCSREENADLFHAMIGGFGMLGCFTRITLQLKRVYSGQVKVTVFSMPNIETIIAEMEARKDENDYLVAWIDGFANGASLGRGDFHIANHLPPGADPAPAQSLRWESQDLPDTIMGFVPKSIMWRFMQPFNNNLGWRLVCLGKYWATRLTGTATYEQSFAGYNFLLDYVPHWKYSYLPGGLIQHQCFVPRDRAAVTFRKLIETTQAHGMPTYLGVVKRHRPDDFLMTHALDGYSLALDFKVTRRNRARLAAMTRELDQIIVAAGGRFYFAKDSTLDPRTVQAAFGAETIARFAALKQRCDPDNILQSNLSRRLFPEWS